MVDVLRTMEQSSKQNVETSIIHHQGCQNSSRFEQDSISEVYGGTVGMYLMITENYFMLNAKLKLKNLTQI